MRCSSYCKSSNYSIQALVQSLVSAGLEPKYFDDVVHVQTQFTNNLVDVFYFAFGAVVIWGTNKNYEHSILNWLNNVDTEINQKFIIDVDSVVQYKELSQDFVSDLIYYRYDYQAQKTYIDEEENEIILHDQSVLIKLSISHALAQSVKLKILESSVIKLLEKTSPLQKELATNGRVSLSKKELSKQIGILFNERYSINLHSDILDTPQFFWRRPRYEPLYLMTVEFQDIQLRQNIMNHRLDMIHELYTILSNELNYLHSTRLEMIIVGLIAIEVVLALLHNDFISRIFS
ncbi:RMD1 family protein [Orientia tsutsugamushi]|uniref:RMD1 family protein n=1 Tax=Orientia tsutsugamushi TaxID=784 RepID=UPI0007E3D932|nr:RMD1 family protein [Orientia tsutsugamushi]